MESPLQSTNLAKRAYWLVRLRWIALALLAGATFVADKVFNVSLPAFALYTIAATVTLYNLLLFALLNYFTKAGNGYSRAAINRIIAFQISADLFILTTILHYSGGIENPFYFYFVFHVTITSVLLSRRQSYLQATLAVLLFGLLVLLEYRRIIPHYTLTGFVAHPDKSGYRDGLFVSGTLLVFTTTLYLVVYMTTSIAVQLRKQQADYEQANIQLKEKDHIKNEYVMRLTHDIKAHLAAIQSCLNIVDDRLAGPLNDRQSDLLQRAYRRTAKCTAFVSALLKLTKMKMTGTLEMSRFSLKNAIFNAFASVESKAAGKSIALNYEIEPSVDEIYGEPLLIEETITNLLLNSIKYTPEKGAVKLVAANRGDYVVIEICDTGIGIPPGEIDKIFDEFYRASNARKVERDGTGLGLSIAKQVVERHGGRIWAVNNQTGGSTFSFTLPKTPHVKPVD